MDETLKLYKYIIKAHLLEPSDKDYEEIENVAKGFFIASNAPFENGKPKMLFMNAWIAHEGRNLNGDAFVSEELRQRVKEGLFTPPFAGMIDLDHDFSARGFWYKTVYAFDEKANKWGILTTGAIWAWRYPELADSIKQQMADQGYVYVSMSALPEASEVTTAYAGFEGKSTHILHNPIFFTSAILTVPPGDFDAKIINIAGEAAAGSKHIISEVHIMNEKEIEALQAAHAQLQQEIADLKVKLTEAEVNFRAVSEIKATVERELETVKADLKVYKDKEAADAEVAKAAEAKKKFEARLAEVPDVVKENLDKHANKELVLARWKEASDTDWDVIKQGFALAYAAPTPTYLSRSKEEGKLPVASGKEKENVLKNFLKD